MQSTFLVVLAASVIIVALCFLGLGIQTFFSKKKKFPDYEVGENPQMQELGIICMHQEQEIIDKQIKRQKGKKIDLDACKTCHQSVSCKIFKNKEKEIKAF